MCGVAGIFRWNERSAALAASDANRVGRMVQALRHRGPDDSDVVDVGGGLVLGHTRLSILDTSRAAHQPMVSPEIALSYNGELYGYRTLRQELKERGATFSSTGDTEVLLRALELDGEAALQKIEGMFAFAAFDRRTRTLMLARDQLGKKPLFFALEDGAIVFASELAAVRAGGVALQFDPDVLAHFLVRGYIQPPRTLCTGVEQLRAAELVVINASGQLKRRLYWTHPWLRDQPPISLECDVDTACIQLRELFGNAVERRLASDVPLGAFLSGGFDSAAVVAVAQKRLGTPMRTFTIGFSDAPGWDESAEATETARLLGTRHTSYTAALDSFDLLPTLVARTGEPQGDSSFIPTHLVSRLARDEVKVVLTGDGGDELFAGYDRFLLAVAAERIPAIAGKIARRAFRGISEGPITPALVRRLKRLARAVAIGPAATLVEWAGGTTFENMEALLGRRLDLPQLIAPEAQLLRSARQHGAPTLNALLAANLATYLPGNILVKLDRASMATSLEARSPLLDLRLLEFAATLGPNLLARGLSLKWIAKRAFSGMVPAVIGRRRKRGFGAPVGAWFRGSGTGRVRERLLGPTSAITNYVDAAHVRRLIGDHAVGITDGGVALFRLLALDEWLRWAAQNQPVQPRDQPLWPQL
jgi:asparagine synthase (glutamine-hydrolysing)